MSADKELFAGVGQYRAASRSGVVFAAGTRPPSRRCEAAQPQPATAAARRIIAANTIRFDHNIAVPHPANSDLARLQLIITGSGHWPIFTKN